MFPIYIYGPFETQCDETRVVVAACSPEAIPALVQAYYEAAYQQLSVPIIGDIGFKPRPWATTILTDFTANKEGVISPTIDQIVN
jgi:4-hydroxy-3-methylbut-2-en-1-yl diphosphate synthase IspG/GcpE